jgi:hypothetical protein
VADNRIAQRPAGRQGDDSVDVRGEAAVKEPPMPVRRPRRVPRVQLNTRVRHDIDELLVRFVAEQSATVQDTVDLALKEFLAARGYHVENAG